MHTTQTTNIREGSIDDLEDMQALFAETIHNISLNDYNEAQLEAWASGIDNTKRWHNILTSQDVFVAEQNKKMIGFVTLENLNYIDLLYVDTDYQNKGIAKQLFANVEEIAKLNNQKTLEADASITALPFFLRMGFTIVKKQNVLRRFVIIENYRVKKEFI